jgi:hypothetical protein
MINTASAAWVGDRGTYIVEGAGSAPAYTAVNITKIESSSCPLQMLERVAKDTCSRLP